MVKAANLVVLCGLHSVRSTSLSGVFNLPLLFLQRPPPPPILVNGVPVALSVSTHSDSDVNIDSSLVWVHSLALLL